MKKIAYFLILAVFLGSCSKSEDASDSSGSFADDETSVIDGDSTPEESAPGESSEPGQSGQPSGDYMTAGEWNDLNNWDFWNGISANAEFSSMATYWNYEITKRVSVKLIDSESKPVVHKKVDLYYSEELVWSALTDNFGSAELWIMNIQSQQIDSKNLSLKIENQTYDNISLYETGVNEIKFSSSQVHNKKIDICFVVDATGSMGDELEYLKTELINLILSVKAANTEAVLNLSSVFYRDQGDEYITRKSDFSEDAQKTVSFIGQQSAAGGGDFPEAVHSALSVTINELQWSETSYSKIVFLILDAPPHTDTQIVSQIHKDIKKAAEKGIKLIPIAASGIDKQTEFLLRYFAISTNGTYVFITNHSGIGNNHLEATVGDYQVEYLNKLIERLINKYLE